MIYGKLWMVVRPQVGIPIFLGAVAVGSFSTHLAIASNTTWVKDFLSGKAKVAAVQAAPAQDCAPPTKK